MIDAPARARHISAMNRPSALVPVIAGFSVMLILMAAVTAIGVTYVRVLSSQLTAIVSERNEKSELATTMRAIHEARYQSLMLASNLDDAFARDEEIMRFAARAIDFIKARDKFLALPLDEAELNLWNSIRQHVRSVETVAGQATSLLQAGDLPRARALIASNLLPQQEAMMAEWRSLVELQRMHNQAALANARSASDKAQQLTLLLSASAVLVGLIIAVFVVRLSRRLEDALFAEKERAQVTLQAIGDAVVCFDEKHQIHYLNPVAESLLGARAATTLGQPVESVMYLFDRNNGQALTTTVVEHTLSGLQSRLPVASSLCSAQGIHYEVEGTCAPIHVSNGSCVGGVLVMRDVSDAREMHRKLTWQADHDELTGLLNRRAFEEKVAKNITSQRAAEFPLSLLYIDLDYFKRVNDSAGHAAGDELLRQIAKLMQSQLRESDTLARMGGDEFAAVLLSCPDQVAERIARAISDCVASHVFTWEGTTHLLGASVGVVHVPPRPTSLDECLAAADHACYQAKQNGRGTVVVHEPLETGQETQSDPGASTTES